MSANDCVTKTKLDNLYDCRHSLTGGNTRATHVMMGGRRALAAGFSDVDEAARLPIAGKARGCWSQRSTRPVRCSPAWKASRYWLWCQLWARSPASRLPLAISTSSSWSTRRRWHCDTEIGMAGLEDFPGIKVGNIKPHADLYGFPDGCGALVLAASHLSGPQGSRPSPAFSRTRCRPRGQPLHRRGNRWAILGTAPSLLSKVRSHRQASLAAACVQAIA